MPWKSSSSWDFDKTLGSARRSGGSFTINDRCFIRKQHKCGKIFGASKSCFIACPTNDYLEPFLVLISEKLSKVGIETFIAVKERQYGQDIFCTKICGKIIESKFCIVILDDSTGAGINVPNPNVYYEYGLMTALRKHIIPLQKEDLKLAFNIQNYDTIKYNNKNIATEIDVAIRDAVKFTEVGRAGKSDEAITDKFILRKLELTGFEPKDTKWVLSEVIADTAFKGFGHRRKGFYAYIGRIDNQNDVESYLDDLKVVIYRTEKVVNDLQEKIQGFKKEAEGISNDSSYFPGAVGLSAYSTHYPASLQPQREKLKRIGDEISGRELVKSQMSRIFLAFIVNPDIDIAKFIEIANTLIKEHNRYKIIYSTDGKIKFENIIVDLSINSQLADAS